MPKYMLSVHSCEGDVRPPMSAEQMHDSVILGDAAYEVVPGYLAQMEPEGAKNSSPAPDTELLAAFILDKLT